MRTLKKVNKQKVTKIQKKMTKIQKNRSYQNDTKQTIMTSMDSKTKEKYMYIKCKKKYMVKKSKICFP